MLRVLYLVLIATEVLTSDYTLLNADYYNLDQAGEIFDQFLIKYNKKYEDRITATKRFETFKENLKKINEWNKEGDTTIHGVNEFTDMTFDEFSKCYLGFNGKLVSKDAVKYEPSGIEAPASMDWRSYGYVTEVKSQQSCGSCFAFSAIGNIEGQYAKAHGARAFSLSNQQAFDCSSAANCETGGLPHEVFQALTTQGGSMREQDYPYEAVKGQCRTDRSKIAVKVTGGQQLGVAGEDGLKDAVASYGPLSIAICADAELQTLRGGQVYKPKQPCNTANHAVLLVGYGNEGGADFWLIKNSWGYSFGDQGYFRLIRGQMALAVGSYVATSTVG
ncbi:unnamed protein product [Leptosia nina]|uniref:Uncharacterized protein n=1 Tax=Leptosia nina TaxID=320188 RepID=A0AAV1JLU7_9NEOP